jgi:hypothetical protein
LQLVVQIFSRISGEIPLEFVRVEGQNQIIKLGMVEWLLKYVGVLSVLLALPPLTHSCFLHIICKRSDEELECMQHT